MSGTEWFIDTCCDAVNSETGNPCIGIVGHDGGHAYAPAGHTIVETTLAWLLDATGMPRGQVAERRAPAPTRSPVRLEPAPEPPNRVGAAGELKPDWSLPPGDILAAEMKARGLTAADVAKGTPFGPERFTEVLEARAPLTEEIAAWLETSWGTPAGFWLRLEANWQEFQRQQAEARAVEAEEVLADYGARFLATSQAYDAAIADLVVDRDRRAVQVEKVTARMNEQRTQIRDLSAEVARLRQLLWDIYGVTGCDQDGQKSAPPLGVYTPDVPELAVEAVRELLAERDRAVETGEY